jgi:hypothetical protein
MKGQPASGASPSPRSRAWLWVVAAFAIQAVVWAVWINLATKHPVQEVPLVHRR